MSIYDWMSGLSLVNAGIQNTTQFISDTQADNPFALGKFLFNMGGSAARIDAADHLARHGNLFGYGFNSFVPYTDTFTNSFALMNSSLGMFNCGFPSFGPHYDFGCGGSFIHHPGSYFGSWC